MATDPNNKDVRYSSPLMGLDLEAHGEPIELRPVNIIPHKDVAVDLSGYYDKQEVDMQLRGKADKSDLVTKADKVELVKFAESKYVNEKIDTTKKTLESEFNAKLGTKLELKDLKNYPVKAEVNEKLDSYYKKSDVDALLTEKLSFDDINKWYIKPEMDSLLDRKADKDTVYTKDELDSKFSDVKDSYYYKSVIDSKIEAVMNSVCTAKYVQDNLVNYYTKYDVNYRLDHIYNKNETDEIVNNINNKIDETANQLIENINLVNDRFINYYTQAQVDQLLKAQADDLNEKITTVSNNLNTTNKNLSKNVSDINNKIKTESDTINSKITTEINGVNNKLTSEISNVNNKIASEINTVNGKIQSNTTKITDLDTKVTNNFKNYYNKTESDNLLDLKADKTTVYNKGEIDSKISGLTSTIDTKTQQVTEKCNELSSTITTKSQEFDQKIESAVTKVKSEIDVYTKAESDTKFDGKMDKTSAYTKSEIDNKLGSLNTYAKTTEVYTKAQIDKIRADIIEEIITQMGLTPESFKMPGEPGFGVAVSAGHATNLGLLPLPGTYTVGSAEYGNYKDKNGNLFVCIPRFWYKLEAHSASTGNYPAPHNAFPNVLISYTAKPGYRLPLAFCHSSGDESKSAKFVFVSKYQLGIDGSNVVSKPNFPIATTSGAGGSANISTVGISGSAPEYTVDLAKKIGPNFYAHYAPLRWVYILIAYAQLQAMQRKYADLAGIPEGLCGFASKGMPVEVNVTNSDITAAMAHNGQLCGVMGVASVSTDNDIGYYCASSSNSERSYVKGYDLIGSFTSSNYKTIDSRYGRFAAPDVPNDVFIDETNQNNYLCNNMLFAGKQYIAGAGSSNDASVNNYPYLTYALHSIWEGYTWNATARGNSYYSTRACAFVS